MAGSVYGRHYVISTWGESHGDTVGVVVDGVPAGLSLCEEDIQIQLDKRKPGQSEFTTARNETDKVRIMSGIFEGVTTGTPIAMMVENGDHHSADYSNIKDIYRPGHADFTFDKKFGIRDYRGGGRSSGRETVGRVAAGAIALKILEELGISVEAYACTIGGIEVSKENFDIKEKYNNPLCMPDKEAAGKAQEYVKGLMEKGDSAGGIIECVIKGLKPGVGEPVFDKLDACLAKAVFSIGAVKGFEIGAGFKAASMSGSENNDGFTAENGEIRKTTNNSGGVLGGMSDGNDIVFRAAVKPTPSVSCTQKTVTRDGEETEINIRGRHDPLIVPRAVVVVESMAAVTLVDLLFEDMKSTMDHVRKLYVRDNKQR